MTPHLPSRETSPNWTEWRFQPPSKGDKENFSATGLSGNSWSVWYLQTVIDTLSCFLWHSKNNCSIPKYSSYIVSLPPHPLPECGQISGHLSVVSCPMYRPFLPLALYTLCSKEFSFPFSLAQLFLDFLDPTPLEYQCSFVMHLFRQLLAPYQHPPSDY